MQILQDYDRWPGQSEKAWACFSGVVLVVVATVEEVLGRPTSSLAPRRRQRPREVAVSSADCGSPAAAFGG
jgi:hypothetical protein